jgi:fatty acid desaturase
MASSGYDWVGRAFGVLTMTPYDHWRRSHAIHHGTSGNLDRRGIGDIKTLTVREYFARDWRGRLSYRLYRHPLVMFGLGPARPGLFVPVREPLALRLHAQGRHAVALAASTRCS